MAGCRISLKTAAIWLACILPLGLLRAHNAPSSAVLLDFFPNGVSAELVLPMNELELSFKQPLMSAPGDVIHRHGPALQKYVLSHMHPTAADGRAWNVELRE